MGAGFLADLLNVGTEGSSGDGGPGDGAVSVSTGGVGCLGGGEDSGMSAGRSGAVVTETGGGGCGGCDGGEGPGSVGVTEENFRKNCLFLSVTRPLPSTLILYLLWPRSSMTVPDLSHLWAVFPAPC